MNRIMELADEYAECVKNYTMLHPLREQAHAALQAEVERVASVPMKYKRMEFNAELQQRIAELEAERDALARDGSCETCKHKSTHHDFDCLECSQFYSNKWEPR